MNPSPMQLDRRDFLKGCCAATLAGGSHAAFGATASTTQDTLVVVFLRGAMDALSLLSPGQGHPDRGNYETFMSIEDPDGNGWLVQEVGHVAG